MSLSAKRESLTRIHGRYQRAGRPHKTRILDEFCATCGYHRKTALRLLNRPLPTTPLSSDATCRAKGKCRRVCALQKWLSLFAGNPGGSARRWRAMFFGGPLKISFNAFCRQCYPANAQNDGLDGPPKPARGPRALPIRNSGSTGDDHGASGSMIANLAIFDARTSVPVGIEIPRAMPRAVVG